MLATRIAATATIVRSYAGAAPCKSMLARSFLQNSLSTTLNATGLTFQVSPWDIVDVVSAAVTRRAKMMVHTGLQAKRSKATVAITTHSLFGAQQFAIVYGKPFA